MSIKTLAEIVVYTWSVTGVSLYLYGFLNAPVLGLFLGHRLAQLGDRRFELSVTAPTHNGLHCFCAAVYGLVLPAFYFLSVRTRHELGPWYLGGETNRWWVIAMGVACMAWLVAHWLEAALRRDYLRFDCGWVDRAFGFVAVCLCVRMHALTAAAARTGQATGASAMGTDAFFRHWAMSLVYPQLCFLGATLVYGLAFAESVGARPAAMERASGRRRWRVAAPVAIGALAILFAPFWLSIPRVTHRQAMKLLEENRAAIVDTAATAELDPALLAGIIYVAQTRDHPRWTGDFIERFGLELWSGRSEPMSAMLGRPPLDPSCGLCQMRPSTALATVMRADATVGDSHLSWMARSAIPIGAREAQPALDLPSSMSSLGQSLPNQYRKHSNEFLLLPDNNLRLASLMLFLLERQWEKAGFPIGDRPEILATLYNIGYERSEPKANPRANDFGRRVAEFMKTEECRRLFGEKKG